MNDKPIWHLIERKTAYTSKFVKVYEDKVQLPNGTIIDDYTVIEKPSIVMIVATESFNNLIVLNEYKYAASNYLMTLPAGHIKPGESSLEAAQRELNEETGFEGGIYEEIGVLHEYPTKDLHKVHVVRVKNIKLLNKIQHEDTELLEFQLISIDELKKQIKEKKWSASSALAALTLSGILL